ncbi:hypothetical protein [Alkalitalea saponilacus]
MNKLQFLKEITKSGNQITISGEAISDQIDVLVNLNSKGLCFKECVFENDVYFENIDISYGIKFINCTFKKSIAFNNCQASKFDSKFNFDNYHIYFKSVKIDGGLYFNGNNKIERGVIISNKSVINKLQVKSLLSDKGGFSVIDSTIEKQFDINQSRFAIDFEISENSIINSMIRIEKLTSSAIVFSDSNCNNIVHIWSGEINSLIFNDGYFKQDVNVKAVSIIDTMTIFGTDFKKNVSFKIQDTTNKTSGKLTKIYIESGKFGEQFIVNGDNTQIDELSIITSKQLEGDIYFNSCELLKTKISGNNYRSNIVFNHSNFNRLNFDFFYNYSTLSIISAKSFNENSELSIAHTNLGKSHLFNTSLNTFEKINIYHSVLSEIITANVKWFDDKKLNTNTSPCSHHFSYKKEIYRQLKFALEKQGDRIASLKFKALEMSAFKRESFSKVKWYKRILNIDRFILWVGQSNNFGQNWLKPALL